MSILSATCAKKFIQIYSYLTELWNLEERWWWWWGIG